MRDQVSRGQPTVVKEHISALDADKEPLVQWQRDLNLSTIIEDLNELCLSSNVKRYRDDTNVKIASLLR